MGFTHLYCIIEYLSEQWFVVKRSSGHDLFAPGKPVNVPGLFLGDITDGDSASKPRVGQSVRGCDRQTGQYKRVCLETESVYFGVETEMSIWGSSKRIMFHRA